MTRRTQPQAPDRAGTAGMSLLELLVVVAIAGILTVAALPGYRNYLLRAHRVEARSALLAVAAAQEAHYLHHHEYTPELTAAPPVGLGSRSVTDGGNYTITIDRADANAFTATAIAVGKQERDEHCARFSLDANGARTATHADCWLR